MGGIYVVDVSVLLLDVGGRDPLFVHFHWGVLQFNEVQMEREEWRRCGTDVLMFLHDLSNTNLLHLSLLPFFTFTFRWVLFLQRRVR